ncbi:unnamed protein product, partial [Polarella glacialis]
DWQPCVDWDGEQQVLAFSAEDGARPQTRPRLEAAARRWQPGAVTFCRRCCCARPERSHHCAACGVCVLRMDHHCPWIGNCVGLRNHKFFFQLALYGGSASLCHVSRRSSASAAGGALRGAAAVQVDGAKCRGSASGVLPRRLGLSRRPRICEFSGGVLRGHFLRPFG